MEEMKEKEIFGNLLPLLKLTSWLLEGIELLAHRLVDGSENDGLYFEE